MPERQPLSSLATVIAAWMSKPPPPARSAFEQGDNPMAQLSDKNFPDELHYALKLRALELRIPLRQLVIDLLTEGIANNPSKIGRHKP